MFPEPDGKLSPLKCPTAVQARASPDVKSQSQQQQTTHQLQPPSQQQQPLPQPQIRQPPPQTSQSHAVSANSPIDHSDPRSRTPQPSPGHLYMEPQAFKLRRALQHKESQQVDRNIVRMAGTQRPSSPREKSGLQNWPFDYVKNKIVEEMHRTSDDDGNKSTNKSSAGSEDSNGEQPSQPYLPATNYAYPYSALNINSQVPVSAHTAPTITPKPVDVLEPTPILSSQYEPLSDED